jgi:hypothetical protein
MIAILRAPSSTNDRTLLPDGLEILRKRSCVHASNRYYDFLFAVRKCVDVCRALNEIGADHTGGPELS